MVSRVNQQAID